MSNPYSQNIDSVQNMKARQKMQDQNNLYPPINSSPYVSRQMPQRGCYQQPESLGLPPPDNAYYNPNTNTMPPPPPPPPAQYHPYPQTNQHHVKTQNTYTNPCQYCHMNATQIQRKRMGLAVWSYGCLLFWFTGCCCWIPFVIDGCYDKELVCTGCQGVRLYTKSEYCC